MVEQNNIEQNNIEEDNKSWAYTLLDEFKIQAKRWFIVWIITFILLLISFLGLLGYVLWLHNTTATVVETVEVSDVENIDESTIKIGDE